MGKRPGVLYVGQLRTLRTTSPAQRYVREDAQTLELPRDRQLEMFGAPPATPLRYCACGHGRAAHVVGTSQCGVASCDCGEFRPVEVRRG
jgi:hypothetical protein